MKKLCLLLLVATAFSCKLDSNNDPLEPIDFRAENEEQITDYLAANVLVATKTASGLYYIIENQGDGAKPTATSNVTVAYKGYFLNGTVFDQSNADGISFGLNQVISGWTEGIPLFNEGGNGVLLIPSHLGYGSFNSNGIPGGSVLVFDVNLISVN